MGKQFKESKENPFHKDYGIWSNTAFVLKKCRKYSPSVLIIAGIGIICTSVLNYYLGFFGKFVIDVVGSGLSYEEKVRNLLIIVLVGGTIAGILQFGVTFSSNKVWYRYIHVRMCVIEERVAKVLGINYEYLEKPETLDIHERASQAVGNNNEGFEGMLHQLEYILTNIATLIVTFISVMVLDMRLVGALVLLALLQYAYHVFCIKIDKKNVWDKLGNSWRSINYMERVTQDFEFAKDIRLFSLQDFLLNKEEKIYKGRWKKFDLHQNIWFSHSVVVNITNLIGRVAIYGALFYAVIKKDLTVGNFTLFLSLAASFSSNLVSALMNIGNYGRASLQVDDLRSFLDLECEEEENATDIPKAADYTIEFKNVSYKYEEAEGYALKNLNLTINAGERLAVVGLNGAGKTTMIKLLLKLYEPTSGEILLNGKNIRNYRREDYYKLFSPVFQDVEVMAFPIAENVSMKAVKDTEVERAYNCISEAGLKERVDSLDKGMLTEVLKVVDDEGTDFSGGEKQKLALARALYKNAPIVVLDEPTSALDAIAEQHLYESFDRMIGDKSAVYISHRLASTRFCDNVAMFKSGEMIEYGSHEKLMELNGEYAHMFELQAQYYQKEEGKDE